MTRVAWASDVHLNFISPVQVRKFGRSIHEQKAEALILSGDISEAPEVKKHLIDLQEAAECPVYFVLGNHDYYRGDLITVRNEMQLLTLSSAGKINYLPVSKVVKMTEQTALIGSDGWYDCFHGNWRDSNFVMTDWVLIEDFKRHMMVKSSIVGQARQIADVSSQEMSKNLREAFVQGFKNVVAVTHFPPWKETATHMGKASSEFTVPFYTSKLMGDMFLEVMKEFPDRLLTVFCGHTHSAHRQQISHNIECLVACAEYKYPEIAAMMTFK